MKPLRRPVRIALSALLVVLALAAAALLVRLRQMAREREEWDAVMHPPPPPYPAARCPSFTFPAPAEPPLAADSPYYRPPSCEPPRLRPTLLPTASPLWKRLAAGCDRGEWVDCSELGRRLLSGNGGAEDRRVGLSLTYDACMKGVAKACAAAAGAYKSGTGAPFRSACGEILSQRACDGGDTSACIDLGYSLVHAWSGLHDRARGQALLDKHCPPPEPCPRDDKLGSFNNPDDAAQCEQGDYFACENTAFDKEGDGWFPPVQRSCEAGSSRGCWLLGRAIFTMPEARKSLAAACERGELYACYELLHTESYFAPAMRPTLQYSPLSDDEYMALREVACLHGYASACHDLAEACGPASPQALRLDEAACPPVRWRSDGLETDARACRALGDRYRKGEGVAKDGPRAAAYYHSACYVAEKDSPRDERACRSLAEMYEQGDGVPRDQARALDLYAGLCSIASPECRHYRRCAPSGQCP